MTNAEKIAEIRWLAKERNAVILAHNYQPGEIQDLADHTGDSLELARRATEVEADVIVFCGVCFMAETAAILNPEKTVLIPDASAGCPMADMITGEQLRAFKAQHPGAKAVCYVNSTADVKAECDICVTSGNAACVMKTFPENQEIIFVPDQHLGAHVAGLLARHYILWQGCCPVHANLSAQKIADARAAHPGAPVLVHPECAREVRDAADERLSTGGMCAYARACAAKTILVGTEVGILHRLRAENPEKTFIPVDENLVCPDMKKTTLDNLLASLKTLEPRVVVPEDIAVKARRAIEAMLAVG